MKRKQLSLEQRQSRRLKSVKNSDRRERLEYNYEYDAKKRKAKELGLLSKDSLKLKKPRSMSETKFKKLIQSKKLI